MPQLLLKISFPQDGVTKLLHFDKSMTVFDACKHIRSKSGAAGLRQAERAHGLFLPGSREETGKWLENGRTLDSYKFTSAKTVLEYRCKQRLLSVRTLDGAVRRVAVDDSLPGLENIRAVCARIGIQDHQEYSFTVDNNTSTIQRSEKSGADRVLDTLRREKHAPDTLAWVDPSKTLREQGLYQDSAVVTLRKKFFFSDKEIGANDPVQLHLLYTQSCESVSNGVQPVVLSEALSLSSLRCQAMFGDFCEEKFKKGSIKSILRDFLPLEYQKGIKKHQEAFIQVYKGLAGVTELEAKFQYIDKCRKLSTYGTSFFAVKEKVHRRNKLRHVLLGVQKDCVLTLDIKSKDVIDRWKLEMIFSYFSTPTSFCLNFGHYGGLYIVKTTQGDSIVQLLDGYIALIQQKAQMPSDIEPVQTESNTELSQKDTLKQIVSNVSGLYSRLDSVFDAPGKVKESKMATIESSKLKLSAVLCGLLHSTARLWRELSSESEELVDTISASSCFEPVMVRVSDLCSVLASLGLTERDKTRIRESFKLLLAALLRLLELLPRDNILQVVEQLRVTVEDVSARSRELLAVVGLEKGTHYSTHQSAIATLDQLSSSLPLFLAQSGRAMEDTDSSSQEEIRSCIRDVRVSHQVLSTLLTVLSSCSQLMASRSMLMEATQTLVESVSRLCHTAKAVCLDAALLRDVGASACTVTAGLNSLTNSLTTTSSSLEEAHYTFLIEANSFRQLLKRREVKKASVRSAANSYAQATSSLLKTLESSPTVSEVHQRGEPITSLQKLMEDINRMREPKITKNMSDLILQHLGDNKLSLVSLVAPVLEQVIDNQLLATAHQTLDTASVLLLLVKHSSAKSVCESELLEFCALIKTRLDSFYSLQATFSSQDYTNTLKTSVMDLFSHISSLVVVCEALEDELSSQSIYLSTAVSWWRTSLYSLTTNLSLLMRKAKQGKTTDNGASSTNVIDIQTMVSKMRKAYLRAYDDYLQQIELLKHSLEHTVDNRLLGDVGDGVLYNSLRRVGSLCSQLVTTLTQDSTHDQSYCTTGYQACKATVTTGSLIELVVKIVSHSSTMEKSSILLIQHSSTCLETLSALLQSHKQAAEVAVIKEQSSCFLAAVKELRQIVLKISATGFVTLNTTELSRSANRERTTVVTIEETDGSLLVDALLIEQCYNLSNTLNKIAMMDSMLFSDAQFDLVTQYGELMGIINAPCLLEDHSEEYIALCYNGKALGEMLIDVVQYSHSLTLDPDHVETQTKFQDSIKTAYKTLTCLLKLSLSSENGECYSLVKSITSHLDTSDSLLICSSLAPLESQEHEETDLGPNKTVKKWDVKFFQTVADMDSPNQDAAVSCCYDLLESYRTFSTTECTLPTVLALRDVSIFMCDCLTTHSTSDTALKLASQTASNYLHEVEGSKQFLLQSTMSFIDYSLTTIVPKKWPSSGSHGGVCVSTLLTLLVKELTALTQASVAEEKDIARCVVLIRLTVSSLLDLLVGRDYQQHDDEEEIDQDARKFLLSVKHSLAQMVSKLGNPAGPDAVEAVAGHVDALTEFSEELEHSIAEAFSYDGYDGTQDISHSLLPTTSLTIYSGLFETNADSVDGVMVSDYKMISESVIVMSRVISSLSEIESLSPDKKLWISSHLQMLSSLDLKTIAANPDFIVRLLLRIIADTLILWTAVSAPTNTDWLDLIEAKNILVQSLTSQNNH